MSAPDLHQLRIRTAATRIEHGYLSTEHRQHLADLLIIAAAATDVPTPVAAACANAVDALATPVSAEQ